MSEELDQEYSDAQVEIANLHDDVAQIIDELECIHSTLDDIRSAIESKWDFSNLFWFVPAVLVGSWLFSSLDRWTDNAWYSMKYDAKFSDITIQKEPADCDFFRAPIGWKGCRYKKKVDAFDDKKRREFMRQALSEEERQG